MILFRVMTKMYLRGICKEYTTDPDQTAKLNNRINNTFCYTLLYSAAITVSKDSEGPDQVTANWYGHFALACPEGLFSHGVAQFYHIFHSNTAWNVTCIKFKHDILMQQGYSAINIKHIIFKQYDILLLSHACLHEKTYHTNFILRKHA